MARPTITPSDETKLLGTLDVERASLHPSVLHAIAHLGEAISASGGELKRTEFTQQVEFHIPATDAEALQALQAAQAEWDRLEGHYQLALGGGIVPAYLVDKVRQWAEKEGLADPFVEDETAEAIRRINESNQH